MTGSSSGSPGESKGVAFTNWLVSKASGVLERKSSRRGFILGSAMVGSAVAVAGCAPGTQPGTPYNHITDCAGGLCTDGYTEFCCTINDGLNACPSGSFIGGWWRADYSSFCNGTRYYMDCMQNCCGPSLGNGFCAGCTECRCGGGCDTRRVYCNYFRYGQCHQEIGATGPIACRVVTCAPPYTVAEYACTTALAVDNSTAEHAPAHGCAPPPPPPFLNAAVLPLTGAATALGSGHVGFFARRPDAGVFYTEFDGSSWGSTVNLGGSISSGVSSVNDAAGHYVFARGTTNNQLWYQRNTGSGWAPDWTPLSGNIVSDPSAVSDPSGLFVFARGGDNAVWYTRGTSGSFTSFASLGGLATSDPVAARDSTGIYVFVRGFDNAVYYRRFAGGTWSEWASLGGLATSDCWAVADPAGLFVFVRGGANDLYYGRFSSGSWSGFSPLGGFITSDPVAVSDPAGLHVFVRGGGNAVYVNRFTAGSWSGFTNLGGLATAGPVAASDPASGLFVFVRGGGNDLYVQRLLSGSWSGWQPRGGTLAPVRAAR